MPLSLDQVVAQVRCCQCYLDEASVIAEVVATTIDHPEMIPIMLEYNGVLTDFKWRSFEYDFFQIQTCILTIFNWFGTAV